MKKCIRDKKYLFKNIVLVGAFIGIIGATLLAKIVKVIPELTLSGVTIETQKPDFNIENYMTGTYQNQYDKWFSATFPLRTYYIKGFSQFKYDMFDKSPNKEVVRGKDNYLYEETYINSYLGLDADIEPTYHNTLMEDLKYIQDICRQYGKYFMVCITPSKAELYPQYIPDKYYQLAEIDEIGVDYKNFISGLEEKEINYFDTFDYLKNKQEELGDNIFAKTATHWNYIAGVDVAAKLIEYIEEDTGYDLSNIKAVGIETSDRPFKEFPFQGKDEDIYQLMNLIQGDMDEAYYAPIVELTEKSTERKGLFWEGGSFSWHILDYWDLFDVFSNSDFIFYNQMIRQYRANQTFDVMLNESNMKHYLDSALQNKDIIVLEVNQQLVGDMGYGFPHTLRNYLETYGFPEEVVLENFDPTHFAEDTAFYADGFYTKEEDGSTFFHWISKEASVELENKDIKEEGILVDVDVFMSYLNLVNDEDKVLEVWVNDQLITTTTLVDGHNQIFLEPELIPYAEKDRYHIYLKMNTSFKLSEYLESEDVRELSIKVNYIGNPSK